LPFLQLLSITPHHSKAGADSVDHYRKYVFYGWWKVSYAWLRYLLMVIAYFGVLRIEGTANLRQRKKRLLLTITALFGPLVFSKYANFLYHDVIGAPFGIQGKIIHLGHTRSAYYCAARRSNWGEQYCISG
jgi:hypothetical protein